MQLPDKGIPEEDNPRQKPPNFNRKLPEFRKGAMGRRMKARFNLAKYGTAHQQHVKHVKHEQHKQHKINVENNPKKYG